MTQRLGVCIYCHQALEYIDCRYPYWRHVEPSPCETDYAHFPLRHADYVPAHDCPGTAVGYWSPAHPHPISPARPRPLPAPRPTPQPRPTPNR